MRHTFSFRPRRGLVVYQLVLILLAIVVLILVLLYVSRRNQPAAAPATDTMTSMGMLHDIGTHAPGKQLVA